jgi:RNA polymerase sigma factor (TIGR02999 family)
MLDAPAGDPTEAGAVRAHALAETYEDLRRIARRQLRRFASIPTLGTTALVHEAYLKLGGLPDTSGDRRHMLALVARVMRQVIVDHCRDRQAQKRGRAQRHLPLDEHVLAVQQQAAHIVELNDALTRLAGSDPRLAQVVECRFFGGLSEQETAQALDLSIRTVQRDWERARAWLRNAMCA